MQRKKQGTGKGRLAARSSWSLRCSKPASLQAACTAQLEPEGALIHKVMLDLMLLDLTNRGDVQRLCACSLKYSDVPPLLVGC